MKKPLELQVSSYLDEEGNPHELSAAEYRIMAVNHDTVGIANFIENGWNFQFRTQSFTDGTIPDPAFSQMFELTRLMCGIEVYRNGWVHREKTMFSVFESFIAHFEGFASLRGYEREFYVSIVKLRFYMHSPKEKWNMTNKGGKLFDPETKTIDSIAVAEALKPIITDYFAKLRSADWNDVIWKNFRRKLHFELNYWGHKGFDELN